MKKKVLGITLLSCGIIFLSFIVMTLFRGEEKPLSPIPDQDGVKVIYVTPKK